MTFHPNSLQRIARDVIIGHDVSIGDFVNLYGCEVGDHTKIGPFVEIQKNAKIGARCKVGSHTFICEGVEISDECFVGHHVCFINDRYPAATTEDGQPQTEADWEVIPTQIDRRASIGSGAVILCGVHIGEGAVIGAGGVVTQDIPAGATVAGVPARALAHRAGGRGE
jgi:acetyltransferase-like isoleucine patch superfamily enzyme